MNLVNTCTKGKKIYKFIFFYIYIINNYLIYIILTCTRNFVSDLINLNSKLCQFQENDTNG
jgi:hypothetical protein